MKFLDSNVILRYLTVDEPQKSLKCESLFRDAEKGKISLHSSSLVIAEVVWVLLSGYNFSKSKVIETIRRFLNTPNIHFDDKPLLLLALEIFEFYELNFIDAYNAAFMQIKGIDSLYSYDKHFDLIPTLKRLEP